MKKILPFIIVLAAAIAVFAFSQVYRNEKIDRQQENVTASETKRAEDSAFDDENLIAENTQSGYKLYYKNEIATLVKGDLKLKFGNWGKSVELKKPELFYNDFDSDGENELIIAVAEDYSDETGKREYANALYLVEEVKNGSNEKLAYSVVGSSLWKTVFKNSIKFEITQLKDESRYLQFALNDKTEPITYDEKSGVTDNKYVSYARASADGKQQAYTYESYSCGLGVYSVADSGELALDIQIFVKYKELNQSYYVGNIHCGINFKDNHFSIKPNTISFQPLNEYKTDGPSR